MSKILSQQEIESLLESFGDTSEEPTSYYTPINRPKVKSTQTVAGSTLADLARRNTVNKKIVKDPDYLYVRLIQGKKYYSSPGSTVLHAEEHAKAIFDFAKIRGFIPNN